MRARSKKRAKLYRDERVPLVKELLATPTMCEMWDRPGCDGYAVDVHEIKSRARGGSITDRENLMLLCRGHHTWVTEHPAEARAEGFLLNSWD